MYDETEYTNTTNLYIEVNGKKSRSECETKEITNMEDSCEELGTM